MESNFSQRESAGTGCWPRLRLCLTKILLDAYFPSMRKRRGPLHKRPPDPAPTAGSRRPALSKTEGKLLALEIMMLSDLPFVLSMPRRAAGSSQLSPATLIRLPTRCFMRRFFLIALALIALTAPTIAQAKHPFTFEDMMKLKRVGEPEVSPDGKWAIFSVVDVNLDANTKTPHIWIVPLSRTEESRGEEKSGVPVIYQDV